MITNIMVGSESVTVYDCHSFPVEKLNINLQRQDNNSRRKRKYRLEFGTFDIETSTHIDGYTKTGTVQGYGYMYIWQFCSAGMVCMGRRWEDFQILLRRINKHFGDTGTTATYVIYVHNLAFEFGFMSGFFTACGYHYDVFAVKNRRVLVMRFKELNIEFRCSYKLTNRGLEKYLHDNPKAGMAKMVGDLDYRIERTPISKLSDQELGYCIVDVLGLYRALKSDMENTGDTIASIPLTSTGYVRRALRERIKDDKSYKRLLRDMALDVKQYKLVKRLAKGGDTLASLSNRLGEVSHNVGSLDIKSSYPTAQLTYKYPMGRLREEINVTDGLLQEIIKEGDYFITEFTAYDVELINPLTPIPCVQKEKCDMVSDGDYETCILYNGRILKADYITIAMDMISWQLFKKQYRYSRIIYGETYSCIYDYLPEVFCNFVRDMFHEKCLLEYQIKEEKHTEDEIKNLKADYNLSKYRFNGIYGMTYTSPIHEDFIYNPESYDWEPPGKIDFEDPKTAAKLYRAQVKGVGAYLWGVHTAAIGRLQLDDLINAVGIANTLYCDTDSDKFKYSAAVMERIDALNKKRIQTAIDRKAYCDIKGKRYYLGVIENETEKELISEFVTLGAKKYCFRLSDGLHITLSGVEKTQVTQLNDDITNFKKGFCFNPAGGITLHYIDCAPHMQHVKGDDNTECDIMLYNHIIVTNRIITIGSIIDTRESSKMPETEIDELIELETLEAGETI